MIIETGIMVSDVETPCIGGNFTTKDFLPILSANVIFEKKIIPMATEPSYIGNNFHSKYKFPEITIRLSFVDHPTAAPLELHCFIDTGASSSFIKSEKLPEELVSIYTTVMEKGFQGYAEMEYTRMSFNKEISRKTFTYIFPTTKSDIFFGLDTCHLNILPDIKNGYDMVIGCDLLSLFDITCSWEKKEFTLKLAKHEVTTF